MSHHGFSYDLVDKIVSIDSDQKDVLSRKTTDISEHELLYAKEIGERLKATLASKGSGAGLAAPQIGISRSVFIYSYDRTPEHLTLVINPSLKSEDDTVVESWEGCFSAMSADGKRSVAKMRRFEKIRVTYTNESGELVEKSLDGFAAKVFQHEYDHLQGYLNVCHNSALEVKTFPDNDTFEEFMAFVKSEDQKRYNSNNNGH